MDMVVQRAASGWFSILLMVAACGDERAVPCGDGLCAIGFQCDVIDGAEQCILLGVQLGICGNGIVEQSASEVCDDGNTNDADGCSSDCRSDERCGNAIIDIGEECDCGGEGVTPGSILCAGRNNEASGGHCREDCRLHCGDGELAAEEFCDPAQPISVSCVDLRYDLGRLGCSASCDSYRTEACGDWNIQSQTLQQGTEIHKLWGVGPVDRFAAGVRELDSLYEMVLYSFDGIESWQLSAAYFQSNGVGGEVRALSGSGVEEIMAIAPVSPIHVVTGTDSLLFRSEGTDWVKQSFLLDPAQDTLELYGLWSYDARGVIAVGSGGYAARFDGEGWSSMATDTTAHLYDVWGTDPQDIIAVGHDEAAGRGVVARYDGTTWTTQDAGTDQPLFAIWRAHDEYAVAVGGGGAALHHDGVSWNPVPTGTTVDLLDVWGNSSEDVYAVGQGGTVLHFDGDSWQRIPLGTSGALSGVWGNEFDDISIAGRADEILSFDGAWWQPLSLPDGIAVICDVWVNHFDDAFAIAGSNCYNGADTILRFNGTEWISTATPYDEALHAIHGTGIDDLYAVGDFGTVFKFDGVDSWELFPFPGPFIFIIDPVLDIRVADSGVIYLVTDRDLWRYIDGVWRDTPLPGVVLLAKGPQRRLWVSESGVVYISVIDFVGVVTLEQVMLRFDGEWTIYENSWETALGSYVGGLWGSGPEDVYAVGQDGIIRRFDGESWTTISTPTFEGLNGIWGTGPDDIFVVGDNATMLHYDGEGWLPMRLDGLPRLRTISGSSRRAMFALGDDGVVYRIGLVRPSQTSLADPGR